MDAEQIRGLEPLLVDYLKRFDDCFARRDTRAHFPVYVRGQLSELPRKSVEPIALAAGTPVRTLQEFLTHLAWDEDRMRSRVGEIVALEHADTGSIGVIDETGWVKKGKDTPGVQRQYCGSVGKQENSIVTVHLGYAAGGFAAFSMRICFCRKAGARTVNAAAAPEFRTTWSIDQSRRLRWSCTIALQQREFILSG